MNAHVVCRDARDYLQHSKRLYDFVYIDPPFFTQRDFVQFSDKWGSMKEYLDAISLYAMLARFLMRPHANFCIHVDQHASHYVKVRLDRIFGSGNFRNEIVWCYNSGGVGKTQLAKKHDTLLVWAKDATRARFNVVREPYPRDYGDRKGFHPEGRMLNDWWQIGILSTTAKERTGYPTQKPLALLERLISVYTNPGDRVLDYHAGSGTTGVACARLGRRCTLVDSNPDAIRIIRERLAETFGTSGC